MGGGGCPRDVGPGTEVVGVGQDGPGWQGSPSIPQAAQCAQRGGQGPGGPCGSLCMAAAVPTACRAGAGTKLTARASELSGGRAVLRPLAPRQPRGRGARPCWWNRLGKAGIRATKPSPQGKADQKKNCRYDNGNNDGNNSLRPNSFQTKKTPLWALGTSVQQQKWPCARRGAISAHGWRAGSATPACSVWNGRGYAPVRATKKHRHTAHKQKSQCGGGSPASCPVQDPAAPAKAQPLPRIRHLPPSAEACPGSTRCSREGTSPALGSSPLETQAGESLRGISRNTASEGGVRPTPQLRSLQSLAVHWQEPLGDPDTVLWGSSPCPSRASPSPGAVTTCWHLQRCIPPATCARNLG